MTALEELAKKCAGNSICIVEGFKTFLDSGYIPGQDEVKYVSSLLGEPTKKVDVLSSRYIDVFTRLLEKNCYHSGDRALCIYSWNPRVPIRYFPVSLDASGTILLIEGNEVSLVAYPTHRTCDIENRGVEILDPEKARVAEVTARVDGYHITFYYNPLLGKWVPATRYVLHNMRYVRNRVVMDDISRIINPYAATANYIAENTGLYDKLRGMIGWTFTFVLQAPEPAILKPNIELYEYKDFKLYLINARDPDGNLLTTRESYRLLSWEHVPIEDVEISNMSTLRKLVEIWTGDLQVRSRFVRYFVPDRVRPYTIEIKSKLYENAVLVKYVSDPVSFIVLVSHGMSREAVDLLTDYKDLKMVGREVSELYLTLRDAISEMLHSSTLVELIRELKLPSELLGELEKARRSGDVGRFSRKLAIALSGDSLYIARERLRMFVNRLRSFQQ